MTVQNTWHRKKRGHVNYICNDRASWAVVMFHQRWRIGICSIPYEGLREGFCNRRSSELTLGDARRASASGLGDFSSSRILDREPVSSEFSFKVPYQEFRFPRGRQQEKTSISIETLREASIRFKWLKWKMRGEFGTTSGARAGVPGGLARANRRQRI